MLVLRRIPLWGWILLAFPLGILWGLVVAFARLDSFHTDWVAPWGELFLRLLKMLAIPLIAVSVLTGLLQVGGLRRLSRLGTFALSYYLTTTAVAILLGLILANFIRPGMYFSEAQRQRFQKLYALRLQEKIEQSEKLGDRSVLQILVEAIPENPFASLTQSTGMLQVIVFCILLGMALLSLPEERVRPFREGFQSLMDAFLWLIDRILYLAPPGVLALISTMMIQTLPSPGDVSLHQYMQEVGEMFSGLGMYMLTVAGGLLLMILVMYPTAVGLLGRMAPGRFLRNVFPAQMVAFSTSSSAATLPVSLQVAGTRLGISPEVRQFVLPLGATVNMDGTALYQAVATLFIAQSMNVQLEFSAYLQILLMAVLASVGAAAIPGAGVIMLIVILESVGIHPAGVALILAVDRPLDMLRTAVNVTGDLTGAFLLHRWLSRSSISGKVK